MALAKGDSGGSRPKKKPTPKPSSGGFGDAIGVGAGVGTTKPKPAPTVAPPSSPSSYNRPSTSTGNTPSSLGQNPAQNIRKEAQKPEAKIAFGEKKNKSALRLGGRVPNTVDYLKELMEKSGSNEISERENKDDVPLEVQDKKVRGQAKRNEARREQAFFNAPENAEFLDTLFQKRAELQSGAIDQEWFDNAMAGILSERYKWEDQRLRNRLGERDQNIDRFYRQAQRQVYNADNQEDAIAWMQENAPSLDNYRMPEIDNRRSNPKQLIAERNRKLQAAGSRAERDAIMAQYSGLGEQDVYATELIEMSSNRRQSIKYHMNSMKNARTRFIDFLEGRGIDPMEVLGRTDEYGRPEQIDTKKVSPAAVGADALTSFITGSSKYTDEERTQVLRRFQKKEYQNKVKANAGKPLLFRGTMDDRGKMSFENLTQAEIPFEIRRRIRLGLLNPDNPESLKANADILEGSMIRQVMPTREEKMVRSFEENKGDGGFWGSTKGGLSALGTGFSDLAGEAQDDVMGSWVGDPIRQIFDKLGRPNNAKNYMLREFSSQDEMNQDQRITRNQIVHDMVMSTDVPVPDFLKEQVANVLSSPLVTSGDDLSFGNIGRIFKAGWEGGTAGGWGLQDEEEFLGGAEVVKHMADRDGIRTIADNTSYQNWVGLGADLLTDPLNFVGVGIGNGLTKGAKKTAETAFETNQTAARRLSDDLAPFFDESVETSLDSRQIYNMLTGGHVRPPVTKKQRTQQVRDRVKGTKELKTLLSTQIGPKVDNLTASKYELMWRALDDLGKSYKKRMAVVSDDFGADVVREAIVKDLNLTDDAAVGAFNNRIDARDLANEIDGVNEYLTAQGRTALEAGFPALKSREASRRVEYASDSADEIASKRRHNAEVDAQARREDYGDPTRMYAELGRLAKLEDQTEYLALKSKVDEIEARNLQGKDVLDPKDIMGGRFANDPRVSNTELYKQMRAAKAQVFTPLPNRPGSKLYKELGRKKKDLADARESGSPIKIQAAQRALNETRGTMNRMQADIFIQRMNQVVNPAGNDVRRSKALGALIHQAEKMKASLDEGTNERFVGDGVVGLKGDRAAVEAGEQGRYAESYLDENDRFDWPAILDDTEGFVNREQQLDHIIRTASAERKSLKGRYAGWQAQEFDMLESIPQSILRFAYGQKNPGNAIAKGIVDDYVRLVVEGPNTRYVARQTGDVELDDWLNKLSDYMTERHRAEYEARGSKQSNRINAEIEAEIAEMQKPGLPNEVARMFGTKPNGGAFFPQVNELLVGTNPDAWERLATPADLDNAYTYTDTWDELKRTAGHAGNFKPADINEDIVDAGGEILDLMRDRGYPLSADNQEAMAHLLSNNGLRNSVEHELLSQQFTANRMFEEQHGMSISEAKLKRDEYLGKTVAGMNQETFLQRALGNPQQYAETVRKVDIKLPYHVFEKFNHSKKVSFLKDGFKKKGFDVKAFDAKAKKAELSKKARTSTAYWKERGHIARETDRAVKNGLAKAINNEDLKVRAYDSTFEAMPGPGASAEELTEAFKAVKREEAEAQVVKLNDEIAEAKAAGKTTDVEVLKRRLAIIDTKKAGVERAVEMLKEQRVAAREMLKRLDEEMLIKAVSATKVDVKKTLALNVIGTNYNIPGSQFMFKAAEAASGLPLIKGAKNAWATAFKSPQSTLDPEMIPLYQQRANYVPTVVEKLVKGLRADFKQYDLKERQDIWALLRSEVTAGRDLTEALKSARSRNPELTDKVVKHLDQFRTLLNGNLEVGGMRVSVDDVNKRLPKEFRINRNYKINYKDHSIADVIASITFTGNRKSGYKEKRIAKQLNDPYAAIWNMHIAVEGAKAEKAMYYTAGSMFGIKREGTLDDAGKLMRGGKDWNHDYELIDEFAEKGYRTIAKMGHSHYFPNDVADDLERMFNLFEPVETQKFNNLVDETMAQWAQSDIPVFDAATSTWKAAATIYNPGYYTRNAVGEIMSSWLGGVNTISPYVKSHKLMRFASGAGKQMDELMDALPMETPLMRGQGSINPADVITSMRSGEKITYARMWTAYHAAGLKTGFARTDFNHAGNSAQTAMDRNVVGSKIKNVHEGVRNQGEYQEDMWRAAHFIDVINKHGGSFDEAVDAAGAEVRKYHFDYTDFSNTEKAVMLRLFPFYKWTRKAAPLMLSMMFVKPGKMSAYPKIMNTVQNELTSSDFDDDSGYLPDFEGMAPQWISNLWAYQIDEGGPNVEDSDTFFRVATPQLDALQAVNGLQGLGGTAYTLANPFIKASVEQLGFNKTLGDEPMFGSSGITTEFGEPLLPMSNPENIDWEERTRNLSRYLPQTNYLQKGAGENAYGYENEITPNDHASFWSGLGFYDVFMPDEEK